MGGVQPVDLSKAERRNPDYHSNAVCVSFVYLLLLIYEYMNICHGHSSGANSSGSKRAKRSGYFAHKKMKHVGIEDLLSPV